LLCISWHPSSSDDYDRFTYRHEFLSDTCSSELCHCYHVST
jgi:hypothetical protein